MFRIKSKIVIIEIMRRVWPSAAFQLLYVAYDKKQSSSAEFAEF